MAGRIGWLFSHFLVPFVFALLSLYVILCGGYRLFVHYPAVKDGVCTMELAEARAATATKSFSGSKVSTTGEGQPEEKVFETSDPCFDTGIKLVEGRHYKVTLGGNEEWNKFLGTSRLFNDPFCLRNSGMSFWQDDGRPATFKGFNCLLTRYHPVYLGGLPTRRLVFVPWFTLVGEIGGSGVTIPFNRTTFQFKAPADGRLYLYVNDAIDSMRLFEETCAGESKCACVDDWRCYYRNNKGSAVVTYKPFGMPEPKADPADHRPRIAIKEMSNGD